MKISATSHEPVRIFCAANAAYAAPLCVMLVSLVTHFDQTRHLEINVLATGIPQQDRKKIERSILRQWPGFDTQGLHWLEPGMEALQGLHVDKWISLETYARLLIPSVLPKEVDRVLYLDSDMVVLADISILYDSLTDNAILHAVRDQGVGVVSEHMGVFNYRELGIPPETPYFNGGVLLINLRRWREEQVSERILEYLRQYQASVHCWDQGGLNAILYNSWTEIDSTWNQTYSIIDPVRWQELGRSAAEWRRTKNHAKIVHYTTGEKPWLGYFWPRYSYFFNYLAKTEYRGAHKGPWLERLIGFRLYYRLWHIKTILLWKREKPGGLLGAIWRRLFLTSRAPEQPSASKRER